MRARSRTHLAGLVAVSARLEPQSLYAAPTDQLAANHAGLAVFAVGLSVILSKQYDAADTNWSYGIIGTVIGFWLKGK